MLKDIPAEQLISAVRSVAESGALLAPSITRRLIAQFASRTRAGSPATGGTVLPRG